MHIVSSEDMNCRRPIPYPIPSHCHVIGKRISFDQSPRTKDWMEGCAQDFGFTAITITSINGRPYMVYVATADEGETNESQLIEEKRLLRIHPAEEIDSVTVKYSDEHRGPVLYITIANSDVRIPARTHTYLLGS